VVIPLAALLPDTITPYLALMVMGFFVGTVGHVYRSKLWVAIGIAMIFAATLLLPLAVIATEDEPASNPQILAPGTR
jgi:H+/Cl- antiporter ClcA